VKPTEPAAREVLRRYLIRCHSSIAEDFPEVAAMNPVNAADYLLHLKDTGRVQIELYNKTPTLIGCRITELASR
jgi:hypothetical protein